MGAITYWYCGNLSPERARELGLGYVMGEGGLAVRGGPGPGGKQGTMFCRGAHGVVPQVPKLWRPYPGELGEKVAIGWDPADPPGPEDLARATQCHGHKVQLADGRAWLAPVARLPAGETPFPRALAWDGKAWAPSDKPARADQLRLYEAACAYWEEFARAIDAGLAEAGGAAERLSASIELGDEADLATAALGINYRVTRAEVAALSLFTDQTPVEVCLALIDWPTICGFLRSRKLPFSEGPTPERGPGTS